MIRRAALLLAAWALVAVTMAGEGKVPATPVRDDQQQLIALDQEWVRAECNNDGTTLERILDPQFVHTFGTGPLIDRSAFIQSVTEGPIDPTLTQTLTDRTVVINGDTAVVMQTDTIRHIDEGQSVEHAYRLTTTYIRRNGHWRALALHMVRVPAK
jgi:ketosteroid isomerase-like protein